MKFNRVNDNKIQIILNKEDLAKHNINKGDFSPYGPEAQRIFGEILEQAYDECGFEIGNNAQLMIEAFPITGESLLLTVTKLGDAKQVNPNPFDFLGNLQKRFMDSIMAAENNQEDSLHFPQLELNDAVYQFSNLENVIEAAHAFGENFDERLSDTQLYRYQEHYYLLFSDKTAINASLEAILDEYGKKMEVVSQFYQEHGEVAMEHKAVSILMTL